jgi:hypothetical protein
MAFTPIDQVRLEIGDNDPVMPNLTDEEIQYFLDKNEGSVRKASLDAAKTILFKIASFANEVVDVLEYRGSDYFRQYKEALMLYIKNPEYGAVSKAMGYFGGISISDIHANISNPDNNYVSAEKSIPVGFDAINLNNTSPFTEDNISRSNSPFNI